MTRLLTFIFCLVAFNAFSQNYGWDKNQKNSVYLDCISSVEAIGVSVVKDKENLCLCYLDKIKDKYSHQEYENKIDVEKKRLKSNSIQNCATELDIEFSNQNIVSTKKEEIQSKDHNIVGTWSFEKGIFSFYNDNEYKYQAKSTKCRGTWSMKGDFLMINGTFPCSKERFEIVKIEEEEIIMYRVRGKKLYHLKRQK